MPIPPLPDAHALAILGLTGVALYLFTRLPGPASRSNGASIGQGQEKLNAANRPA
jgi:hypothetical protein